MHHLHSLPLCPCLHCHVILSNSVPFNGPTNEAIVARLIKEVIANNPQFQACDARGENTVDMLIQ